MNIKNAMSVKVITRTFYLPLLRFFLFPHDQVFMPFPSSGTLRLKPEVFFRCHTHPVAPGYFGYRVSNILVLESAELTCDSVRRRERETRRK